MRHLTLSPATLFPPVSTHTSVPVPSPHMDNSTLPAQPVLMPNSTHNLRFASMPGWDHLTDGFTGRMFVLFGVMAATVSIFLLISALGPKRRLYEYRPTDANEKYPLNLDDDDDEESDVLFDAGRHKLLRKGSHVV